VTVEPPDTEPTATTEPADTEPSFSTEPPESSEPTVTSEPTPSIEATPSSEASASSGPEYPGPVAVSATMRLFADSDGNFLEDDGDTAFIGEGATVSAAVDVSNASPGPGATGSYGWGGTDGLVTVDLHAGNEPIAASLLARYGGQIELALGVFPFPMPDPLPEPVCPDLVPTSDDLVYTIDDSASIVVEASASTEARVRVAPRQRIFEPHRVSDRLSVAVSR
jgi:hypothetical protein